MTVKLEVNRTGLQGEIALTVAPGTPAAVQDRALADALAGPLLEAAQQMGVVLAAAPRRYARPLPGKDAEGRTRYRVAARVEGERLVPALQDAASKAYPGEKKPPRRR